MLRGDGGPGIGTGGLYLVEVVTRCRIKHPAQLGLHGHTVLQGSSLLGTLIHWRRVPMLLRVRWCTLPTVCTDGGRLINRVATSLLRLLFCFYLREWQLFMNNIKFAANRGRPAATEYFGFVSAKQWWQALHD